MRLSESSIEPDRLEIMRLGFRELALGEEGIRQIEVRIEKIGIGLHRLAILDDRVVEALASLEEAAIGISDLGGVWFQPDSHLVFRFRLFEVVDALHNKGVSGVEIGLVRAGPDRVFKVRLRFLQFALQTQDRRQIGVGEWGTRIILKRQGKFPFRFVELARILQGPAIIGMRWLRTREIGHNHSQTLKLTPMKARPAQPECANWNHENG